MSQVALTALSPRVGVEANIVLSKSLDKIFFGGDLEGGGGADQESYDEKLHPQTFLVMIIMMEQRSRNTLIVPFSI